MGYEEYEPDYEDEYYDEMLSDAYARMFSEGGNYDAAYPSI